MKTGRGRNYKLQPDTARFGPYADAVAYMDEQCNRVRDLVEDIPADVANAIPEGGESTIHRLCLHMVAAERRWLSVTVPGSPAFATDPGSPTFVQHADTPTRLWSAVHEALDTERSTLVHPVIADVAAGRLAFQPTTQFAELSQLLEHLKWHWVYHSGQVGLLRRLLGTRYKWTFA